MKSFKDMTDQEYIEFIEKRDIKTGIEIMDSIGYKNTPLGQSNDVTPHTDFRKVGLSCPFEHCILSMPPVPVELGAYHKNWPFVRCNRFGRACPGGTIQIMQCFGEKKEPKPADESAQNKDVQVKDDKAADPVPETKLPKKPVIEASKPQMELKPGGKNKSKVKGR